MLNDKFTMHFGTAVKEVQDIVPAANGGGVRRQQASSVYLVNIDPSPLFAKSEKIALLAIIAFSDLLQLLVLFD